MLMVTVIGRRLTHCTLGELDINTCHGDRFRNGKILLPFAILLSFLNTKMAQVVLPFGRPGPHPANDNSIALEIH